MRHLFFAIPILFLGILAGCVWPPDSTPTNFQQYYPYNAGFDVHRVSQRSLSGIESVVTTISPYNTENYYPYYADSVRYILVNSDTAYRHPIITLPPVYDSAVPYHIDGSANFVTLVYPSFSITDTSYENGLSAQISSPKYGDTVQRSSDLLVGYEANSGTSSNNQNGYIQITDSARFYTLSFDYEYNGTLDFTSNDLITLQGNTVWADLHFTEFANDNIYMANPNYYGEYYSFQRQVDLDRIVAYPLH
jgi:hypothetical protein